MDSSEGPRYRVDPTGPANQQIRDLIAKAAAGSGRQYVADALEAVFSQLKTRPADWGDPLWRTRKEGGMVYHAIQAFLFVRYVVFEPEKVVWLLDVRALSNPRWQSDLRKRSQTHAHGARSRAGNYPS